MSKISCTILITRECPEFFSKSSVLSISQFGSDRNELRKRLVSGIRVCKYVFIRTHWAPLRVNIHASTNDIARSVGSSHLARNCVIAEINERIIKERIEKKRFEGERQKRIRIKYSISYAISLFLFSASRRALENCLARNISRKYLARGNWLRERRRMSQFTIACLPSTPRPSWFAAKRSFIRKMIDASFHFRFLEQNFTRIRRRKFTIP